MKKAIEKKSGAIIGKLGGKATVKKYGRDHMRELGLKGAQSRWGKDKKTNVIRNKQTGD